MSNLTSTRGSVQFALGMQNIPLHSSVILNYNSSFIVAINGIRNISVNVLCIIKILKIHELKS